MTVVGTLAGCRQGDPGPAPAGATVPTAALVTTATSPFAVPPVIEVAYVKRVLAVLDAADGTAFRLYVRDRTITNEIRDRLSVLEATAEGYEVSVRSFEAERDRAFSSPPGDRVTRVSRLITARPPVASTHRSTVITGRSTAAFRTQSSGSGSGRAQVHRFLLHQCRPLRRVVTQHWTATWRLGPWSGTLNELQTEGRIDDFLVRQLQAVVVLAPG